MSHTARIAGVGMIAFAKPGASDPYPEMGAKAARAALADAGIDYDAIEQAYVGYVYGDSTCGQRALYEVGMSGIPIVNVNNNCSTGSTALYLARQAIGIRQSRAGILGGVAGDGERLLHARRDGGGRKVGAARMPASLADVHGDADALVAVVGNRFHLALADGDRQAECL